MVKYTTDQAKVHLNSDMEAIRNSIMKNVRQMQNFRRITWDLKNSKHNLKYNFIFLKNVDQQKEQVICYQVSLITKETTFQTKEMDLSKDTKTNLSLLATKLTTMRKMPVFEVRVHVHIWTEYWDLRVSPRIHSECGVIRARSTPMLTLFTQMSSEHLLCHFNTIVL